ncbi:hypothetical protein HanIR_Chr03g0100761 [Helianthus annuus]|nr:hypothetical protein HanIR_Chr03g0100761 [Helianthus annuus]
MIRLTKPYSIREGTDSKIKRKLHTDGSSSDFFVDKELMKTKSELQLSDDQIEVISTRLPIDKADLKKFFPKNGVISMEKLCWKW